tara:strand:- start:84 stop:242 length:159 start_codon:yes stop_codon:yes gene_type:complete
MQDSMDLQSCAHIEDIDHLHQRTDDCSDDLEGVQDAVGYLLMGDEQSYWEDD